MMVTTYKYHVQVLHKYKMQVQNLGKVTGKAKHKECNNNMVLIYD